MNLNFAAVVKALEGAQELEEIFSAEPGVTEAEITAAVPRALQLLEDLFGKDIFNDANVTELLAIYVEGRQLVKRALAAKNIVN